MENIDAKTKLIILKRDLARSDVRINQFEIILMILGLAVLALLPVAISLEVDYLQLKPSSGVAYTLVMLAWGMILIWAGAKVKSSVERRQGINKILTREHGL